MEEDYLQPEFDPNSLTIAKLKSLLADNGIELPMKQEKKAFYVELFRQHIASKASAIYSTKKVKPSSAGIQEVTYNGSPMESRASRRRTNKLTPKKLFSGQEDNSEIETATSVVNENPFQKTAADTTPRKRSKSRSPSKSKFINYSVPNFPIAGYVNPNDIVQRNKAKGMALVVKQVLVAFMIVGAVSTFVGFVLESYSRHARPYCTDTAADTQLIMGCKPCPPNSKCIIDKNGEQHLVCNKGYIFNYRPFPFASFCSPDKERLRNMDILMSETSNLASKHAGAVECGLNGPNDSDIVSPSLDDTQLKILLRNQHQSWSKEQFDDYWKGLVAALYAKKEDLVKHNLKVISRGDGSFSIYSTYPDFPLGCRFRKFVTALFFAYQYQIYFGIISSIILGYLYTLFRKQKQHAAFIDDTIQKVVHVLIEQERRYRQGQETKSALSINHLRDFFLHLVKNIPERNKIWNDVRIGLLHNSNIRETAILIEGEQHDAWQWIGTSTLLSPKK